MKLQIHKVELFRDTKGLWRWRRVATNGEIVSVGGESYHHRVDAVKTIRQVNRMPYRLFVLDEDEPPVDLDDVDVPDHE